MYQNQVAAAIGASALQTNKVLKNTYILLSMTLLFSAAMAGVAMAVGARPMGLLTLVFYFGLFYLVNRLKNSPMGILAVFALTGFLGWSLGPMLSMYLTFLPNGAELIMTALGGTGLIVLGLSAYVLTTKKDFSFMGGFLAVGIMVAFLAAIANMFMQIQVLSLVISAVFMLISSGMIMYQTSQIIHGGERNYLMATVSLYVSIFNIFVTLLHLLGAFGGDD